MLLPVDPDEPDEPELPLDPEEPEAPEEVSDEPDDPVDPEPLVEPEEPVDPEDPVEPEELEPRELEPELPFEVTSILVRSPVEEKLARTWSPSLMSVRDAVCPSFVTCVESLTLSASVSSFFDLSNFWTLPVTSFPEELADVEPIAPLELEPIEPLELPVEPVPIEPLLLPVLPELLPVLSLPVELLAPLPIRSVDDEPEPDPPVAPDDVDPLDPLLPLLDPPDCAHAGAATSSPAAARLATLPHSIFIAYPSRCSVWRRPGTLPWLVVWLPKR